MTAPLDISPAQVMGLLSALLGRGVKVSKGQQGREDPIHAIYEDDNGVFCGIWTCDRALGAFLGAALSMMPAEAAKRASLRPLDGNLEENLSEVFNIGASLLNGAERPHCRLRKMGQGALPPEFAAFTKRATLKVGFTIAIDGYGQGVLTLWGV